MFFNLSSLRFLQSSFFHKSKYIYIWYSSIFLIRDILSDLRLAFATESPLKMMKNAFYSILKALSFLKIFKFLYSIFDHIEKRLVQKDMVNFKYMTLSLSQEESNQKIKLGQLIEYKMRKIFLEKSYIRCGDEIITRLFSKMSKLSVFLDQQSKVLYKSQAQGCMPS